MKTKHLSNKTECLHAHKGWRLSDVFRWKIGMVLACLLFGMGSTMAATLWNYDGTINGGAQGTSFPLTEDGNWNTLSISRNSMNNGANAFLQNNDGFSFNLISGTCEGGLTISTDGNSASVTGLNSGTANFTVYVRVASGSKVIDISCQPPCPEPTFNTNGNLPSPAPTAPAIQCYRTEGSYGYGTLNINASVSSGAISYQWEKSKNGTSNWEAVSGNSSYNGKTSTFSPTATDITIGDNFFRCIVYNSTSGNQNCSSIISNVSANHQVINTAPTAASIPAGGATFCSTGITGSITVTPTAAGTITYQWQKSKTENGGWSNATGSGATTETLTLSGTDATEGNNYFRCNVTNACGTISSNVTNNYKVETAAAGNISPVGTINLCAANGTLGGTLTVSVTGTGYQWQRNTGAGWSNVPSNGNSQTYTIPASDLTAGVNNQYRCIVTNACGAINSNPSTTYTLTPELAVSLDANSTPIIKCSGTYPSLSVTTTAGVASSYKWYRVGTATNTGGEEIQGAASATYAPPATVAGKTLEGDNYYYCAVTSSACGEPQTTAVSANYPVAITATSTNQTIEVGDNLPLLTPAFGWVSSNTAVATVSGGNIRGLSIGTATLTNTQGDCTSSPITVTVNGRGCSVAPKVEAISGRGASNIQCLGECAGGYMYSYTHAGGNWGELEIVGIPRNQSGWNYFGGIQSSIDWNQSVPNLTIRAEATPVSNTIYYLIINQTNLTITRYTVAEKPECSCVTGSLQGQEICGDETFEELDVLASEPGITYQWYVNETDSDQNGTRLEGETNQTFTPTKTGKTFGKAYYYYCVVMRDDTECGRIKSGAHIVIKTCPDCDNNRFHIRTWGDQVSIGSINSVSANKATRQITPLCAVDACATIFEFTVESNGADANFGIYEGPTSPDNEFNRVIHYPGDDYNSASAIDGASGLAYNRCGDYATSGDNNPTIGCLIYTPNLLNKTTYWLVVDGTNPPYVTSTRPEAIESEVCPEPDVCASFTAPFIPYVIQVGDEINLPDHTNWWLTNGSDVDEVVIPNTSLGTLTGSLSGYAHLAYKKEIDGKSCEKQITIKVQDCNPPAIGNDVNVNQTAPAVREGTGYSWTARTLQVQGVSVEGGGNITYTWYRTTEATAPASNAVPRAGDVEVKTVTNNTNTDSYTPNNLTEAGSPLPANDYRYYCVVSTGSTCNAVSRISGVFSVTEACKDFTIGIEGSSVLSATICAAELPLTFEVKGINPVPAGAWSSSNTSAAIINATTGVVTAGTIAGTTQIRYTQTGCDAVEFPLEVFTSPSISPLLEGETPFQTCANNGLFETELSTSITGSGSYSFQWFRTANKSNPDADKVAVTDTAGTSIYVPTSNENAGIVTGTTYYYFVEAWNNRAGAPINGCRVRSNISIGYLATSGRCDGLTDEIAVTPTISNQFSYAQGEGPSIYQEFILKHGDNITDETDVWIGGTNANAFEYRIGNTGSWTIGNELTRLEAGVQGQDVTIYVRLKAGLLNDNSPFSATLNFLNPSNTVPAIILNGSVRRSAETDCGITDRDDEFYSIDRPASPGYSAYGKDHYLVVSPVGGTYALGGSNNASELPGGSLYIENPTGTLVLQGGGGYTGTDVQNQRFNSATFYVTASGTVNDSAKVTINLNSCTGIVILDGTYVVYTLISPTGLTELRINEGIRVNINENLASERNYSIYNRGDVVIDGDFTFNGGMFFNNGSLDTKGAFTPTNNQHAKFVNNGIAYSNSIQFSGGQVCLATGSCFFSRGNLTLDAAFGEEEAKLGTPDQRGLTGGGGLHVQGNYATGSGAYLINKTDGGTLGRRTFVRNGESTVLTVSETSEANNGKEFSTESNAGLTDLGTDIEVGISQYGCAACFMVDDTNFSFEDSICAGAEANVHVIADASPYFWDVEDGHYETPNLTHPNRIKAIWDNKQTGYKMVSVEFNYDGNQCHRNFNVFLKRATPFLWIGDNDDDDNDKWHTPANWDIVTATQGFNGRYVKNHISQSTEIPSACSDVYLQHDIGGYGVVSYPSLDTIGECKDIYFGVNTSVGKIHNLKYRSAYIDMSTWAFRRNTPTQQNWYMVSAPLKNMFTSDYTYSAMDSYAGDHTVSAYIREFSVVRVEREGEEDDFRGEWSLAISDPNRALNEGTGYSFRYTSSAPTQHTFFFPKPDVDPEDPQWGEYAHLVNRTEPMRDRFIVERNTDSIIPANLTINFDYKDRISTDGLTLYEQSESKLKPGEYLIVGNPFMSHLDLHAFYRLNKKWIYPDIKQFIVSNNGFGSHEIHVDAGVDPGSNEESWVGDASFEFASSTHGDLRYVAPMQSFFVKLRPAAIAQITDLPLNFFPEKVAVAMHQPEHRLRSIPLVENELRLQASLLENSSLTAFVKARSGANNGFHAGEDAQKLFSNDALIDIYTFAGTVPSDVNMLNADSLSGLIIPINVSTQNADKVTISISGISGFTNADNIWFVDAQEGTSTSLFERESFTFNLPAGITEGRFSLHFEQKPQEDGDGRPSDITEEPKANAIHVSTVGNMLNVHATGEKIEDLTVYDVSSRIVYSATGIHTNYFSYRLPQVQAVYFVKVVTDKQSVTRKVIIK